MKDLNNKLKEILKKMSEYLSKKDIEFISDKQYDEFDDKIYDYPRVGYITKHDFYNEYVVCRINKGELFCKGVGDNYGEVLHTNLDELSMGELDNLYTEIYNLDESITSTNVDG